MKTQEEILRRARESESLTVSIDWGYVGRRRFGRRAIKAANALRQAGKLALVQATSDALYRHRHGQNGRVYTTTFRLVVGTRQGGSSCECR